MSKSRDGMAILFAAEKYLSQYPFKINKITIFHQTLHMHEYVQMWYVKSGTCSHFIEDEEYKLKRGDVIILPVGVRHRLDSGTCRNLIMLGCEFLEDLIYDNTKMSLLSMEALIKESDENKPVYSLGGYELRNVEELFEEMVFEYGHRRKCFEFHIKADILKILSIIIRGTDKDMNVSKANIMARHQEMIIKAIDYIDLNYPKKITLDDVCKITMMSTTYFAGVFKEVTGRTFMEYVNNLRIQNAVELLYDNRLTIKEISVAVGFRDPAYFCRIFTKHKGISPGKYRNKITNSPMV